MSLNEWYVSLPTVPALAKKCERGTSDGLKIAAEAALKADIIVMTCLWKEAKW